MSQIALPTKRVDAEVELKFKAYGKYLTFLRRHPTHAARILFGIIIPPHESAMLEASWMGWKENFFKCSRGTSKTFTIGSLMAPLRAILFRNVKALLASASRFRGGKMILKDSERLVSGQLASQRLRGHWARKTIGHPKPIKREPDMWSMEFKSHSSAFTIPTNNEESVRGIRATVMVMDERNTFDGEVVQKVYIPFLVVGTDFESPARGADKNQAFYVGTIDYSYRDWYNEIMSAKDLAQIEYRVHRAMQTQDWDLYHSLMNQHKHRLADASLLYLRYDYTDLLIPTIIGKYKVHYPGARMGKDIKFDNRDQCDLIYTYPVDKRQLESKLDEGIIDKESWEAEHRNVFIQASGSVYSPAMVEKVTGAIYSEQEELKRGWAAEDCGGHYVSPILYSCDDPCVLGVDVARTAAFSAFVIIRIGYSPIGMDETTPEYSLQTHRGKADWANVIWAEQHQHLTSQDTAELIREMRKRYNIVAVRVSDIRGIIMDARGGGVHVRDELANPSAPVNSMTGKPVPGWKAPDKIYDPEDDEFSSLIGDTKAWPGLNLLYTTDVMNQELVSFSRAQMEIRRLYIAPYRAQGDRDDSEGKLNIGYLGVRVLKHQLLRIQAAPTPSGKSVRYIMPGDTNKPENQKDMLMAFLYACYGVRQLHNEALRTAYRTIPEAYGITVRLPGKLIRN